METLVSRFFPLLPFLLLFLSLSLNAQILVDRDPLRMFDDSYSSTSIWEIGLRGGIGYRSKDRFQRDLENFTSTFQPGIISQSSSFGFRNQRYWEGLVRLGFSERQRFGFVLGELDFLRAGLNEITSDGYITRLDFGIQTKYLIFTYHYIWPLGKNWGIEAGMGFGGNETGWSVDGFSTNGVLYFPQVGNLKGNGISLRMENSLNYRARDNVLLQLGWIWALHTVPSFSGTWNGAIATFFIREDGKTTPLSESRLTDSIIVTNQFARALDMSASYFGLHFSAMLRISD